MYIYNRGVNMDDMLNVPTFTKDKDDLKIMKTASLNKKSGTISGKKKLSRKEVLRRIKYVSSVARLGNLSIICCI